MVFVPESDIVDICRIRQMWCSIQPYRYRLVIPLCSSYFILPFFRITALVLQNAEAAIAETFSKEFTQLCPEKLV